MFSKGVISKGITCPIIKKGDDIVTILGDAIIRGMRGRCFAYAVSDDGKNGFHVQPESECWDTTLQNRDVIGVTESIVARAQGNYVTVDDIAAETESLFGKDAHIYVVNPIYSRNRFSMILKGIARAAKTITLVMPKFDEVGNPSGVNRFTGVNIREYYEEICASENCEVYCTNGIDADEFGVGKHNILYCGLHDNGDFVRNMNADNTVFTLADYFTNKCEYGLLGSNKATEESLKLFPNTDEAKKFVTDLQKYIREHTGKNVEVMIYGDGCFKDPIGGIWEFADPVTSPAYTSGLEGCPYEIKVKAFADDKFANLKGKALDEAIAEEIKNKGKDATNKMSTQGTTPRRFVDLLASLMDLTSGSGDRCTPVVVVQNYFRD